MAWWSASGVRVSAETWMGPRTMSSPVRSAIPTPPNIPDGGGGEGGESGEGERVVGRPVTDEYTSWARS